MTDFMRVCTEMEENIIEFGAISHLEAQNVRNILQKSILEVEQKLAG